MSYNTIVPVPVREARSGIFDHKFTVQTFKYLLACFIPPRKGLLRIILYIHFRHSTSSSISFNTIVPVPVSEARIGIFVHKFTVQTLKYLLACFIPPRKLLLHIILYIHLHAYVFRLRAAFHTILLSMYLCEKLKAEFSTINLRSKHSNTCLHVSFHPGKAGCILFYIYTSDMSTSSSISFNTIVPVPVREARSGIFEHKLRSKHANTCLHVSFHPEKSSCILFYIYSCMRTCVDLKQHFIQYYCPCTCA